mgnify:CR=1 FL=1
MSEQIKFNPGHPVRVTGFMHGRMLKTGRPTFFHVMSYLWEKAKAEYDAGDQEGQRVKKFEEYATAVNRFYRLLSEAARAGDKAVEESRLDPESDEAEMLSDRVEHEWAQEEFGRLREYFVRIQRECEVEFPKKTPAFPV